MGRWLGGSHHETVSQSKQVSFTSILPAVISPPNNAYRSHSTQKPWEIKGTYQPYRRPQTVGYACWIQVSVDLDLSVVRGGIWIHNSRKLPGNCTEGC